MLILTLALALTPPDPRVLVNSAIGAMQRTTSLRDAASIRLAGIQHEYILGNAERAEGPWRVQYSVFGETRHLRAIASRRTDRFMSAAGTLSADRVSILRDSVTVSVAAGREVAGSSASFEDAIDRIDGSPERALLLAAGSPKLSLAGTAKHYGITYDVVSFPWRNGRMRIEINRDTHLPDAIEIVRTYADNFRWNIFGESTMRTEYVNWTILPSGAWFPMQQRTFLNGEALRDVSLSSVRLDAAAAPSDSFTVSDSSRVQFTRNSAVNFSRFAFGARGQPTELAPGIVRVPDQWAMTMVRQPDGVVIFEAHISPQYVAAVIGEANRRWPGAPIKAFVLTSDPWAHLGGLREVVSRGIPVYASAGSIPFLTRLVKDAKKPAKFIPVRGRTLIGKGENRLELYPVGGPYAERMLMGYFPARKLLYGADLVFFNRGPTGQPTTGFLTTPAEDLRAAVARENLEVDTVFCVQNYPTPIAWTDFLK